LGDPQAQRALNATFINAANAANEAALAARDVRRLTNAAGGVLQQSSGVIGEAGGVLRDNRKQLNTLLVNLDRTTRNAADTVESVNFILKQSNLDKSAKEISGSLSRAAKNVEDTTASFKGLSGEETQKELRTTLTALRESSEALRDTANSIKSFVADDNSQGQIKGTLTTLNTTANTLAQTSENLRDATAGIKNIFGDPKVQDDVKAIPAELRRTLEATTSTAERMNNLLGGRRRSRDAAQTGDADGTGNAGEDGRQGALLGGFNFTARHLNKSEDKNFGDIGFQTELFGGPFRVGLDEIGEGSRFTLQSGKFLGDNAAIRYGLYRSKLGVGADYRMGRFSLEANLYDPNDRSWNVYGGVRLSRGVELLLGRENRGSVRSNAIAVRLRP
jgi:ABC-type transporter Mla subunit MlaD